QRFNFSKYIFESLVRNVDSSSKFYMYLRFIQLIIQTNIADLSKHTNRYISPVLTQKVFANMRRVGKGFLGVDTPLFENMLAVRAVDAEEEVQGRISVDIDQDEGIELVVDQEKDAEIEGRQADKQAEIYNIDLDHSSKVLSMQEDNTKVQEAIEVVTTAKLITEVVTAAATQVVAASIPISAAKPKSLKIAAAPAVSTRRRKGVAKVKVVPDTAAAAAAHAKVKGVIVQRDLDKIKEVNINCILMANLQHALTSSTQTNKAPVYDLDGSTKVYEYANCYNNEIFNMFTQEEQYTELLDPNSEPHQKTPPKKNSLSRRKKWNLKDVIENGNSFKPTAETTTDDAGTSTTIIPGPVTIKEKAKKNNDLQMALPNEHLMTFNEYKDAKTLFVAIETRFVWRIKLDLDIMSLDDLYNNFKIIKQETGKKITINGSDIVGYDKSKVECFNFHKIGHFVRECRVPRNQENKTRNQETTRRTVNVEDTSSKVMVAIDRTGFDWSYMADNEASTNMAFIGLSDSDKEDDVKSPPEKERKNVKPSVNTVEVEIPKQKIGRPVKYAEMYKTQRPRGNKRNWNNLKSYQLGSNFVMYNAACYVCRSFNHLQAKCKYHQRERMLNGTNHLRVNHNATIVPKAMLTRTGLTLVNSVRLVNPKRNFFKKINTAKEKVNTARPNSAVLNVVRENKGKAAYSHKHIEDQGYFDSGCSWHMTRNISYLNDFKEFDEGYVEIKGGAKGGKITSKGTIRTDLFGPTFMSSIMYTKYCLVITDDYSIFTLVFFLATKDETSRILKSFITKIENLVDKKVKIIRCDNGTKLKNRVMNEFCEEKGINREYIVARSPQQNRVTERRNSTLIKAVRTMLADSKSPITFWTEVVNMACYVQNRENEQVLMQVNLAWRKDSVKTILMTLWNDGSLFDSSPKDSDGANLDTDGLSIESKIDN
nr:putative ribonuclease H-like domain-containing protein [Tanacetum cinerariifolium]